MFTEKLKSYQYNACLALAGPVRGKSKEISTKNPDRSLFEANVDVFKIRSSHRTCSLRKSVLRNFAKFTRKHLCQSLLFNKVAGLRPATLLKRDSGMGVFLWILQNFYKHLFYRTPLDGCFYKILQNENPKYLFSLIRARRSLYLTRNAHK